MTDEQKEKLSKAKVMLCVVENRFEIPVEYAKLLTELAWTHKVNILFWRGQRRTIWWTRQRMIDNFLKEEQWKEYTHLLFLDTDVIPKDPDWLERLILHDKDLISGYYCDINGKACSFSQGEKGRIGEGLEEVDYFSMGFSLIKREVLEKVPYPEPTPICKLDADSEFCWKAKLMGYNVWQDFNLKAFHLLRNAY